MPPRKKAPAPSEGSGAPPLDSSAGAPPPPEKGTGTDWLRSQGASLVVPLPDRGTDRPPRAAPILSGRNGTQAPAAPSEGKPPASPADRKAPAPPSDRKPAPASPPLRLPTDVTWSWQYRHESGMFGVLRIGKGTLSEDYLVERVSTLCYQLTRLTPGETTTYTLTLPVRATPRCTCPGGKRTGQGATVCKHLAALLSATGEDGGQAGSSEGAGR